MIKKTHHGIGFIATATYSDCEQHRYCLDYHWGVGSRVVAWIGLNPSTATERKLDPTLRRIRRFSEDWGYDGFSMLNLFSFRATQPEDMKAVGGFAVGKHTDRFIESVSRGASMIVAAWGSHGSHLHRDQRVLELLSGLGKPVHCLGYTKSGLPVHPLYIPADRQCKQMLQNGESSATSK